MEECDETNKAYVETKWFDSADKASAFGEFMEEKGYTVFYMYDAMSEQYRVRVYA